MIELEGGRRWLYQWDLNQRVIVDDFPPNTRVEVSRRHDCKDSALPVLTYEEGGHICANIPNILLQYHGYIHVKVLPSACDAEYMPEEKDIKVVRREKPDDYVYTETETLSYQALSDRIKELEENGGSGTVKSVNGIDPDENGHVKIDIPEVPEIPENIVQSVNGVVPDESGNVEVDALPDDVEQIAMLIDTDLLPAVHDASGAILTDQSGNIILRY